MSTTTSSINQKPSSTKASVKTSTYKLSGEEYLKPWVRPWDVQAVTNTVLVNGCFDIIHTGHYDILYVARRLATDTGRIVVALDSDRLVSEKKGPDRPINNFFKRYKAMSFLLKKNDLIVEIDKDEEFLRLVHACRPLYRVRGAGDYNPSKSRIPHIPTVLVPKLGGSTTELIERVRGSKDAS